MTPELLARLMDAKPVAPCAWCPDFDPTARANRGVSHGMCAACSAKLHAEMDALGFAK